MSDQNMPTSFQFTEDMKGFITFGTTNYEDGYERGKQDGCGLKFHLTIRTENVEEFLKLPAHEAQATGYVDCDQLGGKYPVERGVFNLFVDGEDLDRKSMKYRLFFHDEAGQPVTLSGFKRVQARAGAEVWRDTTTLYTNLFRGHVTEQQEAAAPILAAGILRLEPADFLKELTTLRAYGPNVAARAKAAEEFGRFFLGSLWDVYGPSYLPQMQIYGREIPLYTTEGVTSAEITTHPFSTADKLGLSLLRFLREPCDDVVVIIHGLTTSSDMFIMPEHYNLVQYLLNHGFTDVWTLDFRMSNRFPYNLRRHRYNLDDIALYDYPPAFAKIRELVGSKKRLHVICHCLGSVSFMMSLFGKAVQGITSVISNSVSLTPRVPFWSKCKLIFGPFLIDYLLGQEYLNPYWRREPGFSAGKVLASLVSWFHRECDVPECHMLSFMWGSGVPALYRHENLLDITHRRGGDLYGGTSMHYYRHVRKMVFSQNTAVKYDPANPKYQALPNNYLHHAVQIETPVLFMTGEQNRVFSNSNIVCHDRLQEIVPGRHELAVFASYGHQDVFMGKNIHQDVFPRLMEFLTKHGVEPRTSVRVPAAVGLTNDQASVITE
jgi:cholesterol oxidase